MPLLDLWKKAQENVSEMSAQQILAISGDGILRDGSPCSHELREYLTHVEVDVLEKYAHQCLYNKFQDSGFFLQDIVNELGRRLEYKITNGIYHGVKGKVGHDGIWASLENTVIVEVKSSTVYSIDLNRIAKYKTSLLENGDIKGDTSILIVIGNEDTANIEAQIRGSRYAWDIRIISIDALIKLAKIKESTEEESTVVKIRSLLIPFESTKLDRFIDIMFTAATDIEESIAYQEIPSEDDNIALRNFGKIERTKQEDIETIKRKIINFFEEKYDVTLTPKTKALFWNEKKDYRIFCAVSKRYPQTYATYWYTLRRSHREFLSGSLKSFIVLSCTDSNKVFIIPMGKFNENIEMLNQTKSKTGNLYWHICISENGEGDYAIVTQKEYENFNLSKYINEY